MDWKAQIDKLGISICPNSSVAMAGAVKLYEKNIIKETDHVVAIMTAHGSKFSNTAVEYHQDSTNKFSNLIKFISPKISNLENVLNL